MSCTGYKKVGELVNETKILLNSNSEVLINNSIKTSFTISNDKLTKKYNYKPMHIDKILYALCKD